MRYSFLSVCVGLLCARGLLAQDAVEVNAQWVPASQEQYQAALDAPAMAVSLRGNMRQVYETAGLPPDTGVVLRVAGELAPAPPGSSQPPVSTPRPAPPPTPPPQPPPQPRPAPEAEEADNTGILVAAGVLGGFSLVCLCGWMSRWWARSYRRLPAPKPAPATVPVRIDRPPPQQQPFALPPQQQQPPPPYAPQQPAYAPQPQPAYAPQQPVYAQQQPVYAPQQPAFAMPVLAPPQQQPAPAVYFPGPPGQPSAPPLPAVRWPGATSSAAVVFKIPGSMLGARA